MALEEQIIPISGRACWHHETSNWKCANKVLSEASKTFRPPATVNLCRDPQKMESRSLYTRQSPSWDGIGKEGPSYRQQAAKSSKVVVGFLWAAKRSILASQVASLDKYVPGNPWMKSGKTKSVHPSCDAKATSFSWRAEPKEIRTSSSGSLSRARSGLYKSKCAIARRKLSCCWTSSLVRESDPTYFSYVSTKWTSRCLL